MALFTASVIAIRTLPYCSTDIEYNIENQTITFTVFDEGNGFDFNDLPDPTSPENLEKPQGRGIFLMNHLADEVNFIDNGNIVQLKFSI